MLVILDMNNVIKDHKDITIVHSIDDVPSNATMVFSIGDTYVAPIFPCFTRHRRARKIDHQLYNIFLKEVDDFYERSNH